MIPEPADSAPPSAPPPSGRGRVAGPLRTPPDFFKGADVTAMAHFYRGEMNRLTAWRARMDMTTNWAVLATVGLLSFSFKNPSADAIFIVTLSALWFLLTVESRRYRFYDVWRWRVRILEAHFVAPVVSGEERFLQGPWREDLTADLLYPTFKMTMREAMGRRLLRNYVYLFGLTLVVSLAHILGISATTSSWSQLRHDQLVTSLRENRLLLGIMVVAYVPLGALIVFGWRQRHVTVELHDQPIRRPYRI